MSVPCPKCGADSEDTGSKYVCGECYWVFDKGGGGAGAKRGTDVPATQRPVLSKDPKAPLPYEPPASQSLAPAAPSVCPKCAGKLTDIGGKYVCDECYWVVDQPGSSPSRASRNSFAAPAAIKSSGSEGEEPMSPKAIGGIALILLLVLMIVVLAIRH